MKSGDVPGGKEMADRMFTLSSNLSKMPAPISGVRIFIEANNDPDNYLVGERLGDIDDIASHGFMYVDQNVVAVQHPDGCIELAIRGPEGISVIGTSQTRAGHASPEIDLIGNLMVRHDDAYALKFELMLKPREIALATIKGFLIASRGGAEDMAVILYAIDPFEDEDKIFFLEELASYQPYSMND